MEDKCVTVIPVTGMTCQNCVSKIELDVAKLSSVVSVKVTMHFMCNIFDLCGVVSFSNMLPFSQFFLFTDKRKSLTHVYL